MKKTPKKSEDSEVKKRLAKLINIKSIVTLSHTFTLLIMVIFEKKVPEWLAENYKYILLIYFGAQTASDVKSKTTPNKED